jgi:hypothetical protein
MGNNFHFGFLKLSGTSKAEPKAERQLYRQLLRESKALLERLANTHKCFAEPFGKICIR